MVAGVVRVCIAGVFYPAKRVGAGVGFNFGAADIQQRAQDAPRGFRRAHGCQPAHAAAAQQAVQHRLGLVIQMMRKEQPAVIALLFGQNPQTGAAGGSLRAVRGVVFYLYAQHRAAHAQFAAQRAAKVRPFIGCRLQAVMHMQRVQLKMQLATGAGEQMQQGDGIHAARERQIQARAAPDTGGIQRGEDSVEEQGVGISGGHGAGRGDYAAASPSLKLP